MLALRHRLAIAGVITAVAVAVPAAAMASGVGSPSGKPTPPSVSAAKDSAAMASKSAAAGSQPTAAPSGNLALKQAARANAGKSGAASPQLTELPAAASVLAARLGVSITSAQHALKEIGGLANQDGGVDPASPAFAAIARELGVTPAQLATALDAVKQSLAGK
jgi:hypothetical protein